MALSFVTAPGGQLTTRNAQNTNQLCDSCHSRPKYFDGTRLHQFCGQRCASTYNTVQIAASPLGLNANFCDVCHQRPKYNDGTRTHDFCGKTCANRYNTPSAAVPATCLAPGCKNAVHVNPDGTLGYYCCMSHKILGQHICLMCREDRKAGNSHFCSPLCKQEARNQGPKLLEVPVGHVTFKSVTEQFKLSWKHDGAIPTVRRVYKILVSRDSHTGYEEYQRTVEARGHFQASGIPSGNECRRWHGTLRECTLGDNGKMVICASPTCSLCRIIETSFNIDLCYRFTGWARFGKGIYTSATSSKSNAYSRNGATSSFKAMLLNKVVVGRGYKIATDQPTWTGPPRGYDSVIGVVGGSLNHDELIVYANDAIRPSYLIIYEAPIA